METIVISGYDAIGGKISSVPSQDAVGGRRVN